jgi:hypothetical protein
MAYPDYIRAKARKLRVEKRLSIDEIAERLALPKTTIYYWVRDLPLDRPRRENPHPGTRAMQRKYRLLREAAYNDGRETSAALAASDPTFRDFICIYVGEGYKRNRNVVSIANSDPRVVQLATRWMRMFSRNTLVFSVQYHSDQDLLQIQRFWGALLKIAPGTVQMQRKSNSGRLGGRTWRCRFGVLTVRASDTLLRARMQAWMDCLQAQWLNSPEPGRSSVW